MPVQALSHSVLQRSVDPNELVDVAETIGFIENHPDLEMNEIVTRFRILFSLQIPPNLVTHFLLVPFEALESLRHFVRDVDLYREYLITRRKYKKKNEALAPDELSFLCQPYLRRIRPEFGRQN